MTRVVDDAPGARLDTTAAAVAVGGLFAVNGMLLGGYGGSLPALRAKLGLDSTAIAILLFLAGLAAILTMQIGGRLADRLGARPVALLGLPVIIVGCLVIGFAPVYGLAAAGAIMIGLGNGAMDVAMNAAGVQVERARRRPIMSRFHAFFSIGNFVGAGLILVISGVFGLGGGAVVLPLMITMAVIALASLLPLVRLTPRANPVHHTVDGVRSKIPAIAWLLGLMAIGYGLAEGTAVDWASIHVTDVARVDPAVGAIGLIAVSAFMTVIRLLGDRLVVRFGRRTVVRFGGICAAAGYLITITATPLPLLVLGWALVGFGVGMIAPQVYAVAGHLGGGRVLALVVTFGYATFLMGPAVTGFLVRQLGIQHAMILPGVLCLVIIALAVVLPKNDDGINPRQES
ncbi:MFS transporter [Microlunatus parietis]|uniref:MFS family permease n=1 Tax=Microlunatus parietis TaxID=682979 RepID=A0A7Y9I5N5_9ACTN|nr:MFS transporter [Microlunatus parietis]NYE70553.1 MFS family permease [Microlunatus parietis]